MESKSIMDRLKYNLRENKFQLHLTALLLMLIPPIPLFFAAENGAMGWIWFLIGIVILGNLLVIIVP
jgi:hypothetical protein